jgi:hypothetical protein
VLTRLDYDNSVLVGLLTYLMRRLQSLQHSAARLIFNLKHSDHITDTLLSLHWLCIPERIRCEVAVLTYAALHASARRYLGPLVRVANVHDRHVLRSASTNRLVVPSVKLSTGGSRTFPVAVPQVLNGVLEEVTSAQSL